MESYQQNNKRIAKNTIYLYIRMFIIMTIGLYTSRVVLHALGVSDYGLYNVVGGILSMFTMFSAALTVGTQRFLNIAMGENDVPKLKRTFSLAFGLHLGMAIFILLLAETLGLWFLNTQMNIPVGRETAAFWVYQFSIIGFMLSLVQVPFQSCILAHEEMKIYAYMSIYDAVAKLAIAFIIQLVDFDDLIIYAALFLIVQSTSIMIYNYYCRHKYEECSFSLSWDGKLVKEIAVYSGWNLFGGSLGFLTNQGINILFNIFNGTIVNAARAISMNVNGYILQFVNNFQVAVNPQIIKSWASKEIDKLHHLVINSGRIGIYLFSFLAVPLFIEIDFVLKLWLGEYPEYTAIFVQLILIQSLQSVADYPVGMLLHAVGKLKHPTIVAVLLMLIFPVAYLMLKTGQSPVYVAVASVILWNIQNIGDLFWAHRYTGISVKTVLKKIYLNGYLGTFVMFIVPFCVSRLMVEGWQRFLLVGTTSVIWSAVVIYFFGLTPGMKQMLTEKLHSFAPKKN